MFLGCIEARMKVTDSAPKFLAHLERTQVLVHVIDIVGIGPRSDARLRRDHA